jgi:hypothetical protein
MKKLLAALLMTLTAGTALALPPAVELDRLMLHAQTALDAQSYSEAADNLATAKKLGIALPENFALRYATALNGLGKANEAKAVLEKSKPCRGHKPCRGQVLHCNIPFRLSSI